MNRANILILMAFLVLLGACDSSEKTLFRKDGNWEMTSKKLEVFSEGELQTSEIQQDPGIMYQFEKEGKGSRFENGKATEIEWNHLNEFVEQIIISYPDNTELEETWEVLVFEKGYQKWVWVQQGLVFGSWVRIEVTIELAR